VALFVNIPHRSQKSLINFCWPHFLALVKLLMMFVVAQIARLYKDCGGFRLHVVVKHACSLDLLGGLCLSNHA
jgi:hypothetical protein